MTTDTRIDVGTLELRLSRPEPAPATYLGPHLGAVIKNDGSEPVAIRRVDLLGVKSETIVAEVAETPRRIEPGRSVNYAITLTWSTARGLRREAAVVLEVEREDGQTMHSAALETKDIKTWTPGEESKAVVGLLVFGALWFVMWGALPPASRAPQVILWSLGATFCVFVCSQFYVGLWRGEPVWGTGLVVPLQRRVRPLTDVLLTSVAVWVVLTAPFAFATYLIDGPHLGVGTAGALFTGERARYFDAVGLYAWHAVDVLPFVQATQTLHWTEPVRDYTQATGALLLLYKALVLGPVLAAAAAAWRGRAPRGPQGRTGAVGREPPGT